MHGENAGRFHTLDGMRGLAALFVAAYHLSQRHGGETFAGYLAVDLFFVISGFVIALNYSGRLAEGLTAARFTEMRIIRLFPLYLAGHALGLSKQLLSHVLHDPRAINGGILACHAALGAVMLPSICGPALFPLNGPSWSLFFEMMINIIFALGMWRSPSWAIGWVMAVAAAYLAAAIGAPDYFNVGWGWNNFFPGVARTAFSFSAGILIYRHFSRRFRSTSWLALIAIVAMVAAMVIHVPGSFRPLAHLAIVIVGFPAAVIIGIRYEAPPALIPIFAFLGDLSYPLYAIHWPLIAIAMPLLAKLHVPSAAAGSVFILALIPAAYLASLIDARVRDWISGKLRLRRSAMPQAA